MNRGNENTKRQDGSNIQWELICVKKCCNKGVSTYGLGYSCCKALLQLIHEHINPGPIYDKQNTREKENCISLNQLGCVMNHESKGLSVVEYSINGMSLVKCCDSL